MAVDAWGIWLMKNIAIDKEGFRYKWAVRGVDEDACIADILSNSRIELTDYIATVFAEQYGCVADLERVRLMSHNQYQAYLQNLASRLGADNSYSVDDYRRDAQKVEVLPFHLERFGLSDSVQELINNRFVSVSYNQDGDACFRCHVSSTVSAGLIAKELDCEMVCNQEFNGFYKNDSNRFILEFCDGAVSLLICDSQKSYAAHLAEYNNFYEIEDYDVCLEVYFDGVHMDNLFLHRENVSVAISSLVQRGYDGYNPLVKESWEDFLNKKKTPNLSFRVVEAPTMVREIPLPFEKSKPKSVSELLESASARSQNTSPGFAEIRGRDFFME